MTLLHAMDRPSAMALWTHWVSEPGAALSIAAMAVAYATGVRASWLHAGRGRGIRTWQVWSFAAGILVLAAALMSPIDALADDLFSAHMAQHVLLAIVAPPLLVAGAPMLAALWVLSPATRSRVVRATRQHRWIVETWSSLTALPVAFALHGIALWVWHVPRLYVVALEHPLAHALEHMSFVITGCLMWWGILHPRGRARRAGYAGGMLVLFLTMLHSGALGALITLSHHVWFPAQSYSAIAWGLSPLDDQQLAGLIMWVPGGFLYLIAMSALFLAWLEPSAKRKRVVAAAGAAAAIALSGCGRAEASLVPGGSVARGRATIQAMGCGSCHDIDGVTGAHGLVGPPLHGVASRAIIAGHLANTPENMERWIMDPPSVDSGTAMPNLHVGVQSARDIAAYLYTLR